MNTDKSQMRTQLSAKTRKMVASLAKAKYRRELGLFVAEGTKCVLDTISRFDTSMLIATPSWLEKYAESVQAVETIYVTSDADMARISNLATPPRVVAVYHIPRYDFDCSIVNSELVVALDAIQDPGNLGTIIRVCDWMGVRHIIASSDTVDVYSPKVVQATMGSVARVKVHYVDLPAVLSAIAPNVKVYGTFLDGDSIYKSQLSETGVIVMGNEGHGISPAVAAHINKHLLIPAYVVDDETAESLNVAVATSITLAEFRRRALIK